MGDRGLIICDTDVIIEFYKNKPAIITELKKIGQSNIAISIVTAGELIFGALNKKELNQILKDIAHLKLLYIDNHIGNLHLQLMSDYSLSHALKLPDAFIAATAIHHDIPLYTLNKKDFRYISNLKLHL